MITSPIFFRLKSYLKYLLVSKNRKGHGIHSPFVFDLVTRNFRNKTDPAVVSLIEGIRRKLNHDRRTIEMIDFGTGSEGRGRMARKISGIARRSCVPEKYGRLLCQMAQEFGDGMILEFGTSLGISAMYMASASSGPQVITMEGSPEVAEIARENFADAGLENIRVLTGSFDALLPEIEAMKVKPGLVFIDGNHRKKPVMDYILKVVQLGVEKGVIIIDDINHSAEMAEAWEEIKMNPAATLTVDIYRMGLVFPGRGPGRSHYVVRY
jgi:predicted O-methyltransferase YrrM